MTRGDLISRQAVLDALWLKYCNSPLDSDRYLIKDIRDIINSLPSIQAKRPEGEWEPLGHRMGVLKHPDSEDYKCSICGYESYTIYTLPPKTCPECGADMRESVKKLYDNIMSVPLPGWDENDGRPYKQTGGD